MSVGRQMSEKAQSHGRVCSETCKMLNFHVGVVPKRRQKLQTVECWSRNRNKRVNRSFFKKQRVFTQISRSPISVFLSCRVGHEPKFPWELWREHEISEVLDAKRRGTKKT